ERAVGVENLNAVVARVGDVHVARRVGGDAADLVELPLRRSRLSPRLQIIAVLVEFRDAIVVAEAIGNVDVARTVPRDVGGIAEAVAGNACAWRTASAAPAAFAAAPSAGVTLRDHSAARRHARSRPHVDVLRFPSEHELIAPV